MVAVKNSTKRQAASVAGDRNQIQLASGQGNDDGIGVVMTAGAWVMMSVAIFGVCPSPRIGVA